jgi:hypothetical protein
MLSFKKKSLRTVLEENAQRATAPFRLILSATLPSILSPLPEDIVPVFPVSRHGPSRGGRDDQPKE